MSASQATPIYTRQRHSARYFIEPLPNNIELKMMEIPAGRFLMGAPETEAESSDVERPQHEVSLQGFCMGKYPITQAQWKAVVEGISQVDQELNPDPSYFKGDNKPVANVSWLHTVEFCARLSKHTKRDYMLPSEAEWEYACRAGTTTPFHYGETILTNLVHYNGTQPYGNAPKEEFRDTITEVGSFPPNAFGLHDMHGNVWEWCRHDRHSNYNGIPIVEGTIPYPDNRVVGESTQTWLEHAQNDVSNQLIRGGSYISHAKNCRSASRAYTLPYMRCPDYGFRVVCVLPRGS